MILVLRIAGRANQKTTDDETLKRLRLDRKFACVLIDEKDEIRKGMVLAVKHLVAFGKVSDAFVKDMEKKKPSKDGVFHLHPPLGGFKKSSKIAAPLGILGKHADISLLVGRMLS